MSLTPFKAILIKEFRENLRWAAIIFILTGGLLCVGLGSEYQRGLSLVGRTFLTLCALMYPAAGLALGLIQIFQDTRRGRWQFVTHRPVSRRMLFAGKAAAGIALYLASTFMPLAVVSLWCATPGHVPGPFSWDMIEPACANLLTGLTWYAAGLLMAGRNARWVGSRIIPLGLPAAVTMYNQFFVRTFPESMLLLILTTIFILLGAMGAFIRGGDAEFAKWWAKAPIGAALLAGWFFVVAAAGGMIESAIESWTRPGQFTFTRYRLDRDGNPQICTYKGISIVGIQNLIGEKIAVTSSDGWNTGGMQTTQLSLLPRPLHTLFWLDPAESFMNAESHLIQIYMENENFWFYLPVRRTIEGYNLQTRELVGRLGPSGFRSPHEEPESFPSSIDTHDLYNEVNVNRLIVLDDAVYRLDVGERQIQKIFQAQPDDPVFSAGIFWNDTDSVAVATHQSLHFLDKDRLLFNVPLDQSRVQPMAPTITVGRTDSGRFVVAYNIGWAVADTPGAVFIYNADGSFFKHIDLPPLKFTWSGVPSGPLLETKLFFLPPGFYAMILTAERLLSSRVQPRFILFLLLSAIIYAALTLLILKNLRVPRRRSYLWMAIGALAGPAGILALLSTVSRIPKIRCPACGQHRRLTDSLCPHCHAPAAAPTTRGIEIFGAVPT